MRYGGHVQRIVSSAGLTLGLCRICKRGVRALQVALNTQLWRLWLKQLGQNSIIQLEVRIDHPRRVEIGDDCLIARRVQVEAELPGALTISSNVQINGGVLLDHSGGLRIGRGCLISASALIFTHDHGHDPRSTPLAAPLEIEPDVWIGAQAIILPTVSIIGRGALVAAGAVVTKDVAPLAVVAGNPAKVIAQRKGYSET